MGVGLVMLGASMPLLVLPSSLAGVGAALCFMGVSCALAVTGTLPQVRPCPEPRIRVLCCRHVTCDRWLQLAAEVECMGATNRGATVSLDAVYSMFNTA